MKAATGELNLTVITIIAIAAVMAFFTAFLWPNIKKSINQQAKDVTTCVKWDSSGTKCLKRNNSTGWRNPTD